MDLGLLLNVGLVLLFIALGGLFAAAEMALIAVREGQLVQLEERGRAGRRAARLARDPNRFLAAVQIGVTVAGFFSAAFGASTIAPAVAPLFAWLGIAANLAEALALVLLTLVIAFCSLVFGELVPKRLAMQRAAGYALRIAPLVNGFATMMRPVIALLSATTDAVVKLLGGDPERGRERVTTEELVGLVSTHEPLGEEGREIVSDVFEGGARALGAVVRPMAEVAVLPLSLPLDEARNRAVLGNHSRYPVVDPSLEGYVGYVHVRDLIQLRPEQPGGTVARVLRSIRVLPEATTVFAAVAELRERGEQVAAVADSNGTTVGIVTLEDLVSALLGDIRDEYDADPEDPATPPQIR